MARVNNRGLGGATSLIRHLQILRTVTEAVSRSLDLNEVIQKSLGALTHVTGHEIASLHLVSSDGKMVSVPLPKLGAGIYTVNWVAVAVDSHRSQGDYKFTVK